MFALFHLSQVLSVHDKRIASLLSFTHRSDHIIDILHVTLDAAVSTLTHYFTLSSIFCSRDMKNVVIFAFHPS